MFSVLIIEERIQSAKDFRSIINWKEEDYELLGVVSNGIIGRAIVERQKPDIIFLSTTSRYLGGLSFIIEVSNSEYSPQIVQLYSEEKTVIKDHIPQSAQLCLCREGLTGQTVLSVLSKATTALQSNQGNMKDRYQPFVIQKNEALLKLLRNRQSYKSALDLIEKYDLHIMESSLNLALFYPSNGQPMDSVTFKQFVNHLSSLLRQSKSGEVFFQAPKEIGVILKDPENRDQDLAYYYYKAIIESLWQAAESQLGLDISVVWCERSFSFQTIAEGYYMLQSLAKYQYFMPEVHLLNFRYCEKIAAPIGIAKISPLLDSLETAINQLDRQQTEILVSTLYLSNVRLSMDFSLLEYLRGRLEAIFYQLALKIDEELSLNFDKLHFDNIEQEYMNVRALLINGIRKAQLVNLNVHPVIRTVMNYIREKYAEDISLEMAAANADVSSGYLSRLFRQELNTTFVAYLTSVRMRKAKQMLRNPKYKVADIAAEVGYQDEKYFCRVFKKQVGYAPRAYRKVCEEIGEPQ